MAMLSDLKHVLDNIFNGNTINLDAPVEFTFNNGEKHKIVTLYKKGRTWKMVDDFKNEWTVSALSYHWQDILYHATLSMRDSRVKPRPTNPDYPLSL